MIIVYFGMTLVVVALAAGAGAEYLVGHPMFETHRLLLAAGLSGVGLLLLLLGMVVASRRRTKKLPPPAALVRLLELRHWGVLAMLLGVLTFNFETWAIAERWHLVRSRLAQNPEIVLAREPAETNQVAVAVPVIFPTVKIQGIIYKKDQPVAFIKGESYGIGDFVGEALVKEITRDGLVLQLSNEVKTIRMGKSQATASLAPGGK